ALAGDAKAAGLDSSADRAVQQGLAWMGDKIRYFGELGPLARATAGTQPPGELSVWCAHLLERACDLTGAKELAKEDWFGQNATWLTAAQDASGAWLPDVGHGGKYEPAPDDTQT